jgi:hypothetical protein
MFIHKYINQKGGIIPDLSIEENIEIYQQNVQVDESLRSILNQLISIRDCNNSENLQMLGFKNNNPDLNLLIQKKISTLSENGECNTIDTEGNLIALRHIAAASSIPTVSVDGSRVAVDDRSGAVDDRSGAVDDRSGAVDDRSGATYNPRRNISSNLPPASMPRTQSVFYMPIITEAYYRAKGLAVPQHILDISGRVINLRQSLINQNNYNLMIEALTAYLRAGDNLVKLEYNYRNDRQPNVNNEGHIAAREQEDLLEIVNLRGMSLQLLLEQAIQIHYLS